MSYVVINAISVAEGAGPELERRFAGRAGAVDQAPGFEHFALLRPTDGTDKYLVFTQWATREDFEAWKSSPQFAHGHRGAAGAPAEGEKPPAPVTTANEIWGFDVV
jgi:heme-degrading monooxygenase HmoA